MPETGYTVSEEKYSERREVGAADIFESRPAKAQARSILLDR
jgi:hypothetical protein